jgi:5-methylcytosine-specific restriction endonuclease McrA
MGAKLKWRNQIFNSCKILTPLDINKANGKDKWKIRCFCGKIFVSAPVSIKKGNTESCGCIRNKRIQEYHRTNRKVEYVNYININTNIKILEPLNPKKDSYRDDYICLCPYHDPPLEFLGYPSTVIDGSTASCGCLRSKMSSERLKERLQQERIDRGLDKNDFISEKSKLVRRMLFFPIRPLIFQLDNKCILCGGLKYNVHHIIPIHNIQYDNLDTYTLAFDINNLVTLCEVCHQKVHKYCTKDIDINLQKELQEMVKIRNIPIKIKNNYDKIVSNQIMPWLNSYFGIINEIKNDITGV